MDLLDTESEGNTSDSSSDNEESIWSAAESDDAEASVCQKNTAPPPAKRQKTKSHIKSTNQDKSEKDRDSVERLIPFAPEHIQMAPKVTASRDKKNLPGSGSKRGKKTGSQKVKKNSSHKSPKSTKAGKKHKSGVSSNSKSSAGAVNQVAKQITKQVAGSLGKLLLAKSK